MEPLDRHSETQLFRGTFHSMLHRSWFPERLVGRLVVLRPHVPDNLVAFQRWYTDPDVARLTRYQEGPMQPDEIERFFSSRVVGADSLAMAVHVRDSERLIGTCAFSQLDGDNGSVLYHITIGEKDAWGMGYGTESTELMLEHAFTRLGLHRVSLSVFEFNERAVRSYVKAGFSVEGRARDAIWREGRYWDEIQMSILEDEWRRTRTSGRGREGRERGPHEGRDGRASARGADVEVRAGGGPDPADVEVGAARRAPR